MSRKIIGVTVGTPISAESIKQNIKPEINADIDKLRADLELEEVARADMDNLIMNTWVVPTYKQLQTLQNWTAGQISAEQQARYNKDQELQASKADRSDISKETVVIGDKVYLSSKGLDVAIKNYTTGAGETLTSTSYVSITGIGTCTDTDIVIPKYDSDGQMVTLIYSDSFKDNTSIKSVVIGNNISIIGDNAFSGCTALKTVYILDNYFPPTISNSAFPDGVTIYAPAHIVEEDWGVYQGKVKPIETIDSLRYELDDIKATLNSFINVAEEGA